MLRCVAVLRTANEIVGGAPPVTQRLSHSDPRVATKVWHIACDAPSHDGAGGDDARRWRASTCRLKTPSLINDAYFFRALSFATMNVEAIAVD